MKLYRRDIDGLRALAVIPVVMFHTGFSLFSGGFIGVDVFFVISGYLITKTLIDDFDEGRYSVSAFYERRIRRIFPAFFVMISIISLLAYAIMLPEDLKDLGTSIWGAFLFVSNITFWIGSGDYFGTKSELQPLLHTWSLAVEEQFYIFFPILLFIALKFLDRYRAYLFILLMLAVSFALSIYSTRAYPVASFYLLPTRAWELLAGSALATNHIRSLKDRRLIEIEAAIGAILILSGIFLYTAKTEFPGLGAVPPVLGAFLIIHAGAADSTTHVARIFSLPYVRFIGLISYSLYLWHWPVIVFWRYYYLEITSGDRYLILLLSLLAATISWRFVERPFRARGSFLTRTPLFATTIALIACGSLLGILFSQRGLPQRVPLNVATMAMKSTYHGPRRDCGFAYDRRRTLSSLCVLGATNTSPSFLLIGDSHADAIAAATFEAAAKIGQAGYQISATGYRPLLGFRKVGEEAKYAYLNALVKRALTERPSIKKIIISIYWHQAVGIDQYINDQAKEFDGRYAVAHGLGELIASNPDRRFLLILSPANSLTFGGNAAARAHWFGHLPYDPSIQRDIFSRTEAEYNGIVSELVRHSNVQRISIASKLCDPLYCYGTKNGNIAYADDNHISFQFSKSMEPDIAHFLEQNR
ncbi:acyltransferase [Sphingobium phenoxybenzoativorans]|uniref:Acyltransferase n=1 Tax=Sphingobium phenoxybenzoativorans TaxID=1592790 RepID=A0A975K6G6_9SPHN|nr:acyltransferase family protein [Sphingobium phenoxybenzoativorans]QUT05660.1 acyltransferase [Sphingobium phenoxybenzoativorans]